VKAYNGLGTSYDLLGDFPKAIESYRAALRIDPGIDYIQNNLGYSYLLQEKIEDAIEAFKNAVRLNSQDERFHNNLGLAYAMNGEFDKAFEAFKLAGDETKAYYRLAQFCQKKGFPSLAKEYQDKAQSTAVTLIKPPLEPVAPSVVEPTEKKERLDRKEAVEVAEVVEQPLPKIDVFPRYPEELAVKQVKLQETKEPLPKVEATRGTQKNWP